MNLNYSSLMATNATITCASDLFIKSTKEFASLFYIISIDESIKDNAQDVPNYEIQLFPFISFLIFLEQLIRFYQRKQLTRFEDGVINIGSSFIFTLTRVFLYVLIVQLFTYLHTNYALIQLPLHSVWTWLFSLLAVEFVYYWTHRALHELNILWAAHQFHHMAEDINITTTIRDSILDLVIYDIFPIPLAFIIPPSILALHIQFSLIYQIWLHNEVIGHLGPLEYLINTPRQHRVHHGKNPYCIDKNYGALLMIWDRLFGTYQQELEEEKIVFGCVAPTPATFDPLTLQFGYYRDVIRKFNAMQGWRDKIFALIKGPGWAPGKPRLGLLSDVPMPDLNATKYSYQPRVQLWKKLYIYVHGFIIAIGFYLMADHPLVRFSPYRGLLLMLYVIVALTSFGAIFDDRWFVELLEITRCLLYFALDYHLIATTQWPIGSRSGQVLQIGLYFVRFLHCISLVFWTIRYVARTFVDHKRIRQKFVTIQQHMTNSKLIKQSQSVLHFANKNKKSGTGDNDDVECDMTAATESSTTTPTTTTRIATSSLVSMIVFSILSGLTFSWIYFLTIPSCVILFESYVPN